MSRVFARNKFLNMPKHDNSVYGPSKMIRRHTDNEDYTKARTLRDWLFVKYDMSYKTYRNKSIVSREKLRAEFENDTGRKLNTHAE